jgi:hypothetical protein
MNNRLLSLEKQRCNLRLLYIIYALLYVIAFALLFVSQPFAIGIFIANTVLYFIVDRPAFSRFRKEYKHLNFIFGSGKNLDNVMFPKRSDIDRADVENSLFFPVEDGSGLLCKETFHAIYRHISLDGCEMTTHYTVEVNKKGVQFLSGTWLHFSFPASINTNLCVLSHDMVLDTVRNSFFERNGFRETTSSNASFDSHFYMYAKDESFDLSATKAGKKLLELSDTFECSVAMSIRSNSLSFFLKGHFFTDNAFVKYPITEELMNVPHFPELAYILEIVDYCSSHLAGSEPHV